MAGKEDTGLRSCHWEQQHYTGESPAPFTCNPAPAFYSIVFVLYSTPHRPPAFHFRRGSIRYGTNHASSPPPGPSYSRIPVELHNKVHSPSNSSTDTIFPFCLLILVEVSLHFRLGSLLGVGPRTSLSMLYAPSSISITHDHPHPVLLFTKHPSLSLTPLVSLLSHKPRC